MRSRIAAPVLVGALALGAVALPGTAMAAGSTSTAPKVTSVSINSLTLGTSGTYSWTAKISASAPKGVKSIALEMLPNSVAKQGPTKASQFTKDDLLPSEHSTSTTLTAGFTDTEKYTIKDLGVTDDMAGSWTAFVLVTGKDGRTTLYTKASAFSWKRATTVTGKASAATVTKNHNVTLKGQLNRADWSKAKWAALTGSTVSLQYRKGTSGSWKTVATAKSSSTGALSISGKDTATGYWRLSYAGAATNGSSASAPVKVTVK